MVPEPENAAAAAMACTEGRGPFAGLVEALEKAA
jgi:hypothetical protein